MNDGRANRMLGWILLVTVFVASALLDPWSLSERNQHSPEFLLAMFVRYGQAVVIGLAFLQLIIGLLLSHLERASAFARVTSRLSMVGALVYIVAYAAHIVLDLEPPFLPLTGWLLASAAGLNVVSVCLLLPVRFNPALGIAPKAAVVILCGGLLVDLGMTLSAAGLHAYFPAWINEPDGVPLRMLRLARAAMIALPLLTLLYAEMRAASRPVPKLAEWAGPVFVFGAATMPLILVLAATVWMPFKYLLGLPADAVVAGVIAGAYLAWRRNLPLPMLGWLAVLLSTSVGLLMGLYAFDGPMPDPAFLGGYNDYARRLNRLGHAYVIVFGVVLLNLCRDVPAGGVLGKWLVVVGGGLSLSAMTLLAFGLVPPIALAPGPVVVALGIVLCLWKIGRDAPPRGGA